jgi:hypothetical protein
MSAAMRNPNAANGSDASSSTRSASSSIVGVLRLERRVDEQEVLELADTLLDPGVDVERDQVLHARHHQCGRRPVADQKTSRHNMSLTLRFRDLIRR